MVGKYVRFYKLVTFIGLPFGYILGIFRSMGAHGNDPEFTEVISNPVGLGIVVTFSLISFGLFSWLIVWYIRYMYGSKLKKLDELLEEIDD